LTDPAGAQTAVEPSATSDGLGVGPFFLIAALSVAIVAFLLLRGQTLAALTVLAFTLIGAGLAAAAMYRTVAPLALDDAVELSLVGGRTRAALERDKALTLRSLKELEFDHAMGKLSGEDFAEMRDRLRARAVRLMSQLEGAAIYRAQIERDLRAHAVAAPASPRCAACGTANDGDARFCKKCGAALEAR
jgi:hypothetical protein